ncbi:MAG TPA: sigma-70 family RNA polymerase sigma factor [Anaerolineae bacterium]|nr:sigma-70 family RNA polymerase sigma factor [Anaerolineae bacterium]
MVAVTDNLLLRKLRQGDTVSFETLFERHYERVYGLLFRLLGNRVEAEDITQEVFLKLYQQPLSGRDEDNLSAWLYRVATNMGYNAIRSRKRRWQRNTVLVPEEKDSSNDPMRLVAQQEQVALVRRVLARLPQRQGQMLLLRQMGLSYAELAKVCDVAPGSIGTLLRRAGKAFEQAYEAEAGKPQWTKEMKDERA